MTYSPCDGIGQQAPHYVQLVIAWEYLIESLFDAFWVFFLDNLREMLQNVGHAFGREDTFPQVRSLQAVRVGRIARAIVPTLIKR